MHFHSDHAFWISCIFILNFMHWHFTWQLQVSMTCDIVWCVTWHFAGQCALRCHLNFPLFNHPVTHRHAWISVDMYVYINAYMYDSMLIHPWISTYICICIYVCVSQAPKVGYERYGTVCTWWDKGNRSGMLADVQACWHGPTTQV